jgi:hypothetical protein
MALLVGDHFGVNQFLIYLLLNMDSIHLRLSYSAFSSMVKMAPLSVHYVSFSALKRDSLLTFLASIEEQKKKALKAREQDDRAHFAKSALFIGIASGSQDLYRSTLLWARRYVRDPVRLSSQYPQDSGLIIV